MIKLLYIEADTNDADYVTRLTDITSLTEEQMKELTYCINIIKKHFTQPWAHFIGCKWNTREMDDDESVEEEYKGELTSANIEFMEDYIPYGEFGVHSLQTIQIFNIDERDLINLIESPEAITKVKE